jgi:hypothetical protein
MTPSRFWILTSGFCCRYSKYLFKKTNLLDWLGAHLVAWKQIMERTKLFLIDTNTLLAKKGARCNRTIQQVIKKQAGDPVRAGDIKITRVSFVWYVLIYLCMGQTSDQMDQGQALAVQTAINHVGWAFNRFLHKGGIMSPLVLHLLANEGAQFISNEKGGGIAGGLALVEKSKIPKFQDGLLIESKMVPTQNEAEGKPSILKFVLFHHRVVQFWY